MPNCQSPTTTQWHIDTQPYTYHRIFQTQRLFLVSFSMLSHPTGPLRRQRGLRHASIGKRAASGAHKPTYDSVEAHHAARCPTITRQARYRTTGEPMSPQKAPKKPIERHKRRLDSRENDPIRKQSSHRIPGLGGEMGLVACLVVWLPIGYGDRKIRR